MSNLSIDHHPGVYMIISQVEEEFGRIPVNQTIEETINKDTQTPGGTKGCREMLGIGVLSWITQICP